MTGKLQLEDDSRPVTISVSSNGDLAADWSGSSATDYNTSGLAADTTHLFVFRFKTTSANGANSSFYNDIEVWVNPDASDVSGGTLINPDDGSMRGIVRYLNGSSTSVPFDGLELESDGNNNSFFYWDDIRLGTSAANIGLNVY